eukprot:1392480-Prymnesium_polylepis.1
MNSFGARIPRAYAQSSKGGVSTGATATMRGTLAGGGTTGGCTTSAVATPTSQATMVRKRSQQRAGSVTNHGATIPRVTMHDPVADGRCCGRWPMLSPKA